MPMSDKSRFLDIDFIRGFAIFSVILLHTLSGDLRASSFSIFHIGQAVPIFIAITFFLSFINLEKMNAKLDEWYSPKRLRSLLKRIILPVFVINILQIFVMIIIGHTNLIINVICGGGYGPGSYYLWVYLQLWFLMPFIFKMLKYCGKYIGIMLMLAICVLVNLLMNLFSSFFPMLDKINSLLCFRYLFLAAIAWIWLYKEQYNRHIINCLAILSLVYLFYVMYDNDPSPLVYAGNWASQNYPVYFWTYVIILSLLYAYKKNQIESLNKFFCWMGKNSWQIFIIQMFILGFLRLETINICPNQLANQILFLLMGFILTLLPIYVYQHIKIKYIIRKNVVDT